MAKRIRSNQAKKWHLELEDMPSGSVVLDRFGEAWQSSRIYWYRAYGDSSEHSSWDLSFSGPFEVLHTGRSS